jgi:hypothetical protein
MHGEYKWQASICPVRCKRKQVPVNHVAKWTDDKIRKYNNACHGYQLCSAKAFARWSTSVKTLAAAPVGVVSWKHQCAPALVLCSLDENLAQLGLVMPVLSVLCPWWGQHHVEYLFSCDPWSCNVFVTARLRTRSRGVASRRHLRRVNRTLPPPLIDNSGSDQDDLSFAFGNLSITLPSATSNSRYYSCNLALLFYLICMFNMSSVQVVPTLVAMICDMLNLVVHYVMIYIMILIWKLPNISTIVFCGYVTLITLMLRMVFYLLVVMTQSRPCGDIINWMLRNFITPTYQYARA